MLFGKTVGFFQVGPCVESQEGEEKVEEYEEYEDVEETEEETGWARLEMRGPP